MELKQALLAKEYSTIEKLTEKFSKWLLMTDLHLVEIVVTTVVANRMGGDPLWMLLVAPPSSAKTELIRSLSLLSDVHLLSNLTPNTLLSGMKGKKDASLLPRLSGKVLAMKDFTTILTLHRDARAEIFAQLREVYDGAYSKGYGTGEEKRWEGHVGFLAGVTQVIDGQHAVHTILGERFLLYRPEIEARQAMARKAIRNIGSEVQMRKELAEAMQGFMEAIGTPNAWAVTIPEETEKVIITLADLTAMGRAGVPRDGYERLVQYTPQPEVPARLAKQLALLAKAFAVVHGRTEVGSEELTVLRKVCVDSQIRQRMTVVGHLALLPSREWAETLVVANETVIPTGTCKELLEDCWILRIAERDIEGGDDGETGRRGRKPYRWRLQDEYREMLDVSGIFGQNPPF